MLVLGILVGEITIQDNQIILNTEKENITLIITDTTLYLEADGKLIKEELEDPYVFQIQELLHNYSKFAIIGHIEVGFGFLVLCLVLICILLKHLESLFQSIHNRDTSFTLKR